MLDVPPPWANMPDVQRLKQFWKEQHALSTGQTLKGVNLDKHRARSALPLATGEYSAGTSDRRSGESAQKACTCDPLDFECILKCTQDAMVAPKKCYEKCDNVGCHQECVYVQVNWEQVRGLGGGDPSTSLWLFCRFV
jgi:hypothetical protein